jgi:hypothetical protein
MGFQHSCYSHYHISNTYVRLSWAAYISTFRSGVLQALHGEGGIMMNRSCLKALNCFPYLINYWCIYDVDD